jgi:PAS domain S-box-containing protein
MASTIAIPKDFHQENEVNQHEDVGIKQDRKNFRTEKIFNSMVLVGIFIAIIYFALDTILHIFYSDRFNLIASAIGEDRYEIYIRIIVLCLFSIFGSHAQYTINNLKSKEEELEQYRSHLEDLVEKRTAALSVANDKLRAEINERKRSELALRESEEKYRLLVENSNDAIFVIQDGRVTFPNPKAKRLSSEMNIDISRRPFFDFIYPDDKDAVLRWYKRSLKGGDTAGTHTFKLVDRTGREHWVELNAVLINWEKKIAALNFMRDVTNQKALEVQLHQAQRMESIGTLAGGIAHDFNNLLMGIQGNASVMMLDISSEDALYENIKSIQRCVKSGSNLTKQLLGFARGGKYVVKPTYMNEVLKRTAHIFGRTRKEIKIHRRLRKDIWIVNVDVGQIEQVFLNLYVNAWQAMPDGGDLHLETDNVHLDKAYVFGKPFDVKPGRYVRISITDTGVGMDNSVQQRIFEPFFTTKAIGQGTGLGLASAYGIVKNHGGIITCYSAVGIGTTFNVYLPAYIKERADKQQPFKKSLRGNETVLLVDDEKVIIDVAKKMMESLGYKVLTAKGGNEAISLFKRKHNSIDLVILDMIMPYMGGKEVFDQLKIIDPEVRVLLASGYSLKGQAQEIMDRGCRGFIQKPFDTIDLSRKIREVIDVVI